MDATLLIAAHGTRSEAGLATIDRLAATVRAARPGLAVQLCFLDVVDPRLPEALADLRGRVIVVPALLARGFHVLDDIPALTAGRAEVIVTRQLGPDPRLTRALVDRLREAGCPAAGEVVLVASGSRNPAAAADLDAAATGLQIALGRRVHARTLADPFPPVATVASYLLAEGYFADQVRTRATAAGIGVVTAPLGSHPAVAELILGRYDDAVRARPAVR